MRTKYALIYDGAEHEIYSGSVQNWGDIVCTYSRSGYDGVVRQFSSDFMFTDEVRDSLLSLYLRDGVEASCILKVYAQTQRLEWEEVFSCPFDFSTVKWDDHTFTISCFDNSLAAKIKADKGTKYELSVGSDIQPDGNFIFDRIPIKETAKYEFTKGESDDKGAIACEVHRDELLWLGNTGSEVSVGGSILYKDDQKEDDGGCVLQAYNDVEVTLDWSLDVDRAYSSGAAINVMAQLVRGASVVKSDMLTSLGGDTGCTYLGSFPSDTSLPALSGGSSDVGKWATLQGSQLVWAAQYNGHSSHWANTGKTADEYFKDTRSGSCSFQMRDGDKIRIIGDFTYQTSDISRFRLLASDFSFSWISRGEVCNIPCFRPQTIVQALLERISAGMPFNVAISDYDQRIGDTVILAAESIRNMAEAKIYSSFNEFCDWMSTVFGYTYVIDAPKGTERRIITIGEKVDVAYPFVTSKYNGVPDPSRIVYNTFHGMLLYHSEEDDRYYIAWDGFEDYKNSNHTPFLDVIYVLSNFGACYFVEGRRNPIRYDLDADDAVTVRFLHRAEIFGSEIAKRLSDVSGLTYKVKKSDIFSTLEIGYDKKDYDSINGRDEFNFSNTYSTGTTVTDRKVSMISKYRADCYGIEFLAQKRSMASTDNASDKDVFFVLCTGNRDFRADRSSEVQGTLSNQVFNAAFSPTACVRANAGLLGIQSKSLMLSFASSTGNSSVVIDNEGLSTDITLDTPLASCGEVEFTSGDLDIPEDINGCIEVKSEGVRYIGYVADLDLNYSREEAAKYKLIVKAIDYDN